jgi:hypothetical protein
MKREDLKLHKFIADFGINIFDMAYFGKSASVPNAKKAGASAPAFRSITDTAS